MEFKRGFKHIDKRIEAKGANGFASCNSCQFDDSEEGCTNSNVTSFDIIEESNRTYCPYWKLSE